MRSIGLTAAVAAGVFAFLGAGAAEVSAEQIRNSVAKKAVLHGATTQEIADLPRAALLQAALVMNEAEESTKRDQLARILGKK